MGFDGLKDKHKPRKAAKRGGTSWRERFTRPVRKALLYSAAALAVGIMSGAELGDRIGSLPAVDGILTGIKAPNDECYASAMDKVREIGRVELKTTDRRTLEDWVGSQMTICRGESNVHCEPTYGELQDFINGNAICYENKTGNKIYYFYPDEDNRIN